MASPAVGIDGIELWTGKLKLDLATTFAPAHDIDPNKFTKGLGLHASSLPDVYEDIVTMGANAALRLMQRHGLTPEDIGRIDVATETAFDNAKPVATYIAGCLAQVMEGDFAHANLGERKFACIAGTQALDDAANWIHSGRHRGRKALVIATDTALYERGDPGEATQGAGAVAMLVSESPSVTAFGLPQGVGSADETDFLKPHQQFPSVDGKRSMQVYLGRIQDALADFAAAGGSTDPDAHAQFLFHTPFPGMVKKAAVLGYLDGVQGTARGDALAEDLGTLAHPDTFADGRAYLDVLKAHAKHLKQTDHYANWYARAVTPTLKVARQVGNWYTGSVHVARASGLLHAAHSERALTGQPLIVASYGSGAQAEVHAETVQAGWRDEAEALTIQQQLDARYDLSYDEYEAIHAVHTYGAESNLSPRTAPSGEFVVDGRGPMGEYTYAYVA